MMHDVSRLVRLEADRRARVVDLTLAQWRLLVQLEHNPGQSQTEIAALLEVEPISVARMVDRLEAKGLLERRADAQDRRIWRLHLREKAAGVLETIHVQRAGLAGLIHQGLPPELQHSMLQALRLMKANLLQALEPAADKTREVA